VAIAAFSSSLLDPRPRSQPHRLARPDRMARALMWMCHALKIKEFWLYLLVSFIGLGIFNGVTTC
jgi:hypothetical protein